MVSYHFFVHAVVLLNIPRHEHIESAPMWCFMFQGRMNINKKACLGIHFISANYFSPHLSDVNFCTHILFLNGGGGWITFTLFIVICIVFITFILKDLVFMKIVMKFVVPTIKSQCNFSPEKFSSKYKIYFLSLSCYFPLTCLFVGRFFCYHFVWLLLSPFRVTLKTNKQFNIYFAFVTCMSRIEKRLIERRRETWWFCFVEQSKLAIENCC